VDFNLAKNYLDAEKVEVKKIRDGLGQGMAELGAGKKTWWYSWQTPRSLRVCISLGRSFPKGPYRLACAIRLNY